MKNEMVEAKRKRTWFGVQKCFYEIERRNKKKKNRNRNGLRINRIIKMI